MKGSFSALLLLLLVGTLMFPAAQMTIDNQQTEANGTVDETTTDLERIYQPVTTGYGTMFILVGAAALFGWFGFWGGS